MNNMITAKEIAEQLGISVSKGYQLVKQGNDELKAQGFLVFPGKLPRAYWEKKIYKEKQ